MCQNAPSFETPTALRGVVEMSSVGWMRTGPCLAPISRPEVCLRFIQNQSPIVSRGRSSEQSFISFAQQRLVPALLQCRHDHFDRLPVVDPWTGLTEPIDYARIIIVPHDSYPHELLS